MTENSESAAATSNPSAPRVKRKRGLLARIRCTILLCILLVLIAVQAPVFPHVVRGILKFRAWQGGASLSMGAIEGNLFEPVVVRDLLWTYRADTGAVTRVEMKRMRAWIAWSNIFPAPVAEKVRALAERAGFYPIGGNGLFFRELEMDDVTARLSLPRAGAQAIDEDSAADTFRRALAVRGVQAGMYTVRNADLIMDRGEDWMRISGAHFSLNQTSAGVFRAAEIGFKVEQGRTAFRNVRAHTWLDGSRAALAGMRITPEVTLQNLGVSLGDFAKGKLRLSVDFAAFGGKIEAEAEAAFHDRRIRFDGNGNLTKISVAGLAGFLGLSEATGGMLDKGHFTFHGMPGDVAKSEATARLEVSAFQWESRQWDLLVLGLSLVDQRLDIPEFRLQQGQNQLAIKGSMALPRPGVRWWDRQFDLKIDGDIRNLTELSALMMPEFKYTAGQLFIRGAVSGSGVTKDAPAKYEGQMIVSGTGLQWRTAPFDNLNAALLFHGRELQIINAQVVHADDLMRGSGRISLGDGSYAGELRLSARDVGVYRTVLTPYILPAPVGGGVEATWSGKGGGATHEGNFSAQLNRFRLLGPRATLPLDAEAAGSYRPGEVQVERFRLAEDGMVLTTGITVGPSAVTLRGLRATQHGRVCLNGEAILPLDVWQRGPDVTFDHLLNSETVGRLQLSISELDLRAASRLTGIDWPLAGTATGDLTGEGALAALKLGGTLQLSRGSLPLDWKGSAVRDVGARFSLEGSSVRLEQATGRFVNGDFGLAGTLDLSKPRTPGIDVVGTGLYQSQPFTFHVHGSATHPVISTEGHAPFAGNIPASTQPPPPGPAVPFVQVVPVPVVPVPVVPAPGVPAPGVPAPGVPAPGVPAPGVPAPGVPAPGVPAPGVPAPGVPAPGVPAPGVPAPGVPAPGVPAPGVPAPGVPAPGVPAPGVPAPGVPAPGVPAPGVPAPGVPAPGVPAPGVPAPGVPAPVPKPAPSSQ